MKKISRIVFGFLFLGLIALPLAYACEGGKCPFKGHGGGEYSQKMKSPCPITNAFFEDAHEMLEHKASIGLSADQIKTIKGLKLEMKKQVIRGEGDMQVMMLDVKAQLNGDKFDQKAVNDLIDQGSATMNKNAKQAVDLYAKLKSVLSADQVKKLETAEAQEKAEEEREG